MTTIEENFLEIISMCKKEIKRYEKELKNKRFKFAHFGIRLNLYRMKRSLKHYQDKLNEYRKQGRV
jgi:hypothetical protein